MAPDKDAPREGRTGEARPTLTHCGQCGKLYDTADMSVQRRVSVPGPHDCERDPYQPPAPPSVGDATPDMHEMAEGDAEDFKAIDRAHFRPLGAPSAPPAALPPIPKGHPHREALYSILARRDCQHYRVLPDCVPGFPDAARVRQTIAALEASFAALLASPSVVADAGAGDAFNLDAAMDELCEAESVNNLAGVLATEDKIRGAFARLTSALDAATRRAEADQKAAERWRALIASERVRVLGSAKLGTEYAHIGVEFWATFPSEQIDADAQARGVTWFVEYVDGLRALAPSRAVPTEDRT